MDERAIAEGLVETMNDAACGRRVREAVLEIGSETQISHDALRSSFAAAAAGSAVDGAYLDIREVPGSALTLKSMEVDEAA
jgi:hydrogenase nickel incorporation protein HypA/HybF